jgi:hypothetical protein
LRLPGNVLLGKGGVTGQSVLVPNEAPLESGAA